MDVRAVTEDERLKAARLTEAEIQAYKTREDVRITREKIADIPEFDKKINAIKDKEAEEVLPIILKVLLTIQEVLLADVSTLRQQNPAAVDKYTRTLAMLDKAITIFGVTEKVTAAGIDAQKAYLKKLTEAAQKRAQETGEPVDIFADLKMLVEDAHHVELTENTVPLWMELATLMQGLYWHNAQNVPAKKMDPKTGEPIKSNDGVINFFNKTLYYPRVDLLDGAIFKLYDITKLDVSINYRRASLILRNKIDAFVPEKQVVAIPSPVQTNAPSAIQYEMESVPVADSRFVSIRIRIKEDDLPAGTSIPDIVDSMFANPLGVMLSSKAHLDPEARIRDFEKQLAIYKLSDPLKKSLGKFIKEADVVIGSYTDPTQLNILNPARHLPTYIPGMSFFLKTNHDAAEKAKSKLEESKEDILKQFEKMFAFFEELKVAKSKTLRAEVIKLFLNQIDIIRKCPNAHASRINYKKELLPADVEGYITLQIDIPEKDVEMGQVICRALEGFFANPLGLALAPMMDCNDVARLQHFSDLLDVHGLTPMQKVEYVNFRQSAAEEMNKYTDPSTYSLLNPIRLVGKDYVPFSSLFEHVHVPLRDATVGKMMCSTKVVDQIKYMLDINDQLRRANSTTLGPIVNKFLIDFINSLIPPHAFCAKRADGVELQAGKTTSLVAVQWK